MIYIPTFLSHIDRLPLFQPHQDRYIDVIVKGDAEDKKKQLRHCDNGLTQLNSHQYIFQRLGQGPRNKNTQVLNCN